MKGGGGCVWGGGGCQPGEGSYQDETKLLPATTQNSDSLLNTHTFHCRGVEKFGENELE